jgi:hypothetical protein
MKDYQKEFVKWPRERYFKFYIQHWLDFLFHQFVLEFLRSLEYGS